MYDIRRDEETHTASLPAQVLHAVELAHFPRGDAPPGLMEPRDIRVQEAVHKLHDGLQVVETVALL